MEEAYSGLNKKVNYTLIKNVLDVLDKVLSPDRNLQLVTIVMAEER